MYQFNIPSELITELTQDQANEILENLAYDHGVTSSPMANLEGLAIMVTKWKAHTGEDELAFYQTWQDQVNAYNVIMAAIKASVE